MNSPQPPNPYATAANQAAINNANAQANAAYLSGANNFVGPSGTQTSTQTGTRTIPATYVTNKNGVKKMVSPAQEIPIYTQTTTLSPAEQQKLDLQNQYGIASGQLANTQLGRLSDTLASPLDLSNEATSGYLLDLARKRLDPIWNDRQQSLETELRNQGVQPGTKAYDAAMNNFNYGRNDAYNQIVLQGHQQGVQEQVLARQEPINESLGLVTGIPLNMPQFGSISGASVSPVDLAALQANNYSQKMAQQNAMYGALGAFGGAGMQALGSAYGGWKPPTTGVA